jgi:hypothetical protein
MVMLLHLGMRFGTLFGQVNVFLGCIEFPASFTSLKGVLPDDGIPNFYGARGPLVLHADHVGGTQIGTRPAANAFSGHRNHQHASAVLLHRQGVLANDLFAHSDAQAATNTVIWWRRKRNPLPFRQLVQPPGLRGQLNETLEGSEAGLLNRCAVGADNHSLFDPEYTT